MVRLFVNFGRVFFARPGKGIIPKTLSEFSKGASGLPLFIAVVMFCGLSSVWLQQPPRRTIQSNSNLLQIANNDFVTGEMFSGLSDVAFYTAEYAKQFPSVSKHAKNIIFIDKIFSKSDVSVISSSRIFFIKIDHVREFLDEVIPHISNRFILLTHRSDITAGSVAELLANPLLIRWYGCNMLPHEKTRSVPLGLEDRDMWGRTDMELISRARHALKTKLLYVYFNTKSNPSIRTPTLKLLKSRGFKQQMRKSWSTYIMELSEYKFCASPEGNGVDTHRMWECIYLGVIPVVVRTPELYSWYSDLPILWVDSFDEITRSSLNRARILPGHRANTSTPITIHSIAQGITNELTIV